MNHKLVYRLYREERLAFRRKQRKKLAAGCRIVLPPPMQPHERWSMDFMGDTLATGRTFGRLNIVDDGGRECPAIVVDYGLESREAAREPWIASERPATRRSA